MPVFIFLEHLYRAETGQELDRLFFDPLKELPPREPITFADALDGDVALVDEPVDARPRHL